MRIKSPNTKGEKEGVLLVTTTKSIHSTSLEERLNHKGIPTQRINTDEPTLHELPQLYLSDTDELSRIETLKGYNLQNAKTVWWDEVVPSPERYRKMQYGQWAFLETQKASDWILSSLDAHYVNDPNRIIYASNKTLQLKLARKHGIKIPDTLITSDPEEARRFLQQKGVYKPVSRPTPETIGEDRVVYTTIVRPDEIDDDAVSCKLSLFQRYVPKDFEIRAYVIGDTCLAAEIHSQKSEKSKVDWRKYDISNTPHYPHQMPEDISKKLIGLTKDLGLEYSAIDLVKNTKGEYVLLEVNPQGMWLWIEKLTGIPVTNTLADYLSS